MLNAFSILRETILRSAFFECPFMFLMSILDEKTFLEQHVHSVLMMLFIFEHSKKHFCNF